MSDEKKANEAIRNYMNGINLHDDSEASGWFSIANVYETINQMDEAKDAREKSIKLNKQSVEKVPKTDPRYWMDWLMIGEAYRVENNLDEAISAYRKAIDANPNYLQALYPLGMCLNSKGLKNEAIDVFTKVADVGQRSSKGYSSEYRSSIPQLVTLLCERKTKEDLVHAITVSEIAARKYPNEPSILNSYSTVLSCSGRDKEARLVQDRFNFLMKERAIKDFDNATKKNLTDASEWKRIGDELLKYKLIEDTITAFKEAVRLKPEMYGLYPVLCLLYNEKKDLDNTIHWARVSCQADLYYAPYWGALAGFLMVKYRRTADTPEKQALRQEIVSCLKRGVALNDTSGNFMLGLMADEDGDIDTALSAYNAMEKPIMLLIGFDLFRKKDKKGAIDAFRKAIEIEPLKGKKVGIGDLLIPFLDSLINMEESTPSVVLMAWWGKIIFSKLTSRAPDEKEASDLYFYILEHGTAEGFAEAKVQPVAPERIELLASSATPKAPLDTNARPEMTITAPAEPKKEKVVIEAEPAASTRWKCPSCGNVERYMIKEMTDKTYVLNTYPLIYGKKLVCGKCGHEWRS
jgi:tetratricopeptide (TPR) repeat protein/phage FluMu protein Com